jgi:hypothetical protein
MAGLTCASEARLTQIPRPTTSAQPTTATSASNIARPAPINAGFPEDAHFTTRSAPTLPR